ncbi:M12 family metallo-peptidase [Aquimarina sp. 2201CG5-10]|uniref:M12 family metallo-peptidase n=1 Tax=Aquimarina callyspongiae TaxID=3098150 RepID=UPI002AB381B8|nr:M12 family metallo-peptidase [Aquimarina sp. 2201CG5-10]MDY8135685.1 M12 family metallo-peptidase [Aquimarina sp. 2201CG5-10]
MKHTLMIVIAFFTMIGFSQTQPHKPSQRIQQEKASGATFENLNLFTIIDHQKTKQQIPSELKEYTVFSFNQQKLTSFKSNAPVTMNLQVPGQKSGMSLELVKVDITTDDFRIVEMPSGKVIQQTNKALHYRGIVKGNPNSIAAISFFDNEISGIISVGEESGNLVLGQLKGSKNQIIYRDKEIDHLNDFACQMIDSPYKEYTKEQLSTDNQNKAAVKCPRVFFDIGNDIVNDKGGAQGASNYIEAVFNQVAVLYANDNISIRMSGVNAWTSNTPFNGLDNYRSYRNQNSFNGDLGHFVTYNFSGGVAWVNALCSSYKYAVSGINGSYSNVPTYSWSVEVVAHELGHNLGSNHTQACVWNGNNTAIDGCYPTEGNCARPGLPSGGGTIMSYCHLTNVGINFNKGFGSQPSNVIRNTISSKSCLQTCDGGGCSDGDQVTVTLTNNANCTLEYFVNNTSQTSINAGQSAQVSTTVGTNWVAKSSSDQTIDSFQIVCNQSTYTSSGSCSSGGNPCEGVAEWSSTTNYSVGDRVVYQGNLYERTSTGWTFLGACPSTDPCAGVSEWSSTTNYSVGDRVTYQGNLYERTSSGWTNLGPCGARTSEALSPDVSALLSTELNFITYPNPVKDILNIKVGNIKGGTYQLAIKDINGRSLRTIDFDTTPGGSGEQSVNLSNLAAGMYFVQLTHNKKTITQKVFVDK